MILSRRSCHTTPIIMKSNCMRTESCILSCHEKNFIFIKVFLIRCKNHDAHMRHTDSLHAPYDVILTYSFAWCCSILSTYCLKHAELRFYISGVSYSNVYKKSITPRTVASLLTKLSFPLLYLQVILSLT